MCSRPRWKFLPRNPLVVVQIAFSLALVTAAALFIRGANKAASIESGLRTENTFLVEMDASLGGFDQKRAQDLYRTVGEKFGALPGRGTREPRRDGSVWDQFGQKSRPARRSHTAPRTPGPPLPRRAFHFLLSGTASAPIISPRSDCLCSAAAPSPRRKRHNRAGQRSRSSTKFWPRNCGRRETRWESEFNSRFERTRRPRQRPTTPAKSNGAKRSRSSGSCPQRKAASSSHHHRERFTCPSRVAFEAMSSFSLSSLHFPRG